MRRGLGRSEHALPPRPPSRRNADGDDPPLSVSELTRKIKTLLEGNVGLVTVEGEISGLKQSPSGHIYFSLKDPDALLDCVIWRSAAGRIRELPRDGARVAARGRLGVYEPRGRYQLVVTAFVSEAGTGDLWRRFEELKAKLAAEGLFDAGRKRPLPDSPRTVAIVTSPSGAALRDILKILARRAPGIRAVLAPALVQGRGAAADIARALETVDRWGGADVVIVGRGGGSLEDLWAFNEEAVARAIARCRVPVVSAVGHETDFTIADFAADARAATPSEAAERIAPDRAHLLGRVRHAAVVLSRALAGIARDRRRRLEGAAIRPAFRNPLDMFMPKWQRLDEALSRLALGAEARLGRDGRRLDVARARLAGLSPLAVLERGYAVVLGPDGRALTAAAAVRPGDRVTAVLAKGGLTAMVEKTDAAGTGAE